MFNKWSWHKCISTCKGRKIVPYLSPCTKLKSNLIKDLNIKLTTLNLIEEKVESTLKCIGTGQYSLNTTPKLTGSALYATSKTLELTETSHCLGSHPKFFCTIGASILSPEAHNICQTFPLSRKFQT